MSRQDYEGAKRASPDRGKAKELRQSRRQQAKPLEINEFDWESLVSLIMTAAGAGGAVRIGLTRDGGAWAIGMYMEDDYATEYIRPGEDCQAALDEIARVWLPMGAAERYFELVTVVRQRKAQ